MGLLGLERSTGYHLRLGNIEIGRRRLADCGPRGVLHRIEAVEAGARNHLRAAARTFSDLVFRRLFAGSRCVVVRVCVVAMGARPSCRNGGGRLRQHRAGLSGCSSGSGFVRIAVGAVLTVQWKRLMPGVGFEPPTPCLGGAFVGMTYVRARSIPFCDGCPRVGRRIRVGAAPLIQPRQQVAAALAAFGVQIARTRTPALGVMFCWKDR